MSGSWNSGGGWTEDEIACGLPFVIEHGYWPGDEPDNSSTGSALNKQQNFVAAGFELELNKAISSQTNKSAVQQKVVRKLIQYGANIAVRRYGRMESLPRRHQLLAQSRDCLPLLLRDFFLRVEHITLTPALNNRITSLTNALAKKDEHHIAYQRVAELRDFIHREVAQAKGAGKGLQCDREEMRLLLSTARLHLCLNELQKHHTLDLTALHKRYIALAAVEAAMPSANTLPGRKHIHRWRLRHHRSLLYFFPLEIRQALLAFMQQEGLFASNDQSDLREYKKALVAWCRQCVEDYLSRKKIVQKAGRKKNGSTDLRSIPF